LVASSIFASGWLFGSGRLTISTDTTVPTISRNQSAPSDGVDELYTQIVNNYDGEVSDDDLLDGMKRGMTAAVGDPFTEYLTAEETTAFNESLNGTFEGIGAELGKEGNFVIVVAPIKGTPADKAGIQPQDIIVEIDGESAADITISEAVNRIRGPKGEEVVLTIIRDGQQLEVPIIRDTINIASVEWEQQGSIGIITISRFGDDTTELTRQAATELKEAGVTGIVLDMRGNPGGLLNTSVEVSSVWLPKGSTVLEEKRGGEVIETFKTSTNPILAGVPTVILINEGSASASEIVAGALRDNDVATIYGKTSFGKGSVQRLIPLSAGGSLKVTIARWFTPDGVSIDKEGITPDTEVELTAEDREADRDPQLDAAIQSLQ
jgi:carboxyl-terminal processing protease